jgi:HEAT repeat protein
MSNKITSSSVEMLAQRLTAIDADRKPSYPRLKETLKDRDTREVFEAAKLLHKGATKLKGDYPYWSCVYELRRRKSEEVFEAAMQLCKSRSVRDRQLGCFVLGDDTEPRRRFNREALDQLHLMLKTETNPTVLYAILYGIRGAQDRDNARGVRRIAALRDHDSEKVRYGVIEALIHHDDRTSVATLIHLTRDKSAHIRDWATFGLGSMTELDTPALRNSLTQRLTDEDCNTRCEALVGLARRKDPRVKDAIIRELSLAAPTTLAFEAAADFEDKSLLPLIDRQIASADENTDESWLTHAQQERERLASDDNNYLLDPQNR